LQAELRDYQREGFTWLTRLAEWGVGACNGKEEVGKENADVCSA